MIFGITLKHFAKLKEQGEAAKDSKRTLKLLKKQSNKVFRTRSILDLKVSDYVDLEIYYEEQNFYQFCRIFVKRYFWQTVYLHNMWLIIDNFSKQRDKMYEEFYYIFNPPQYGIPAAETPGSELKKDFVNEFGNWVVLTDMLCNGRLVDYKQVENWKMSEFLFWANYKSGQKIIEAVK